MPSELKKPEPAAALLGLTIVGLGTVRLLSGVTHEEGAKFWTDAQLEQYAADRVREAEEAIADEYASRLQSDLEHGVRSINERYARNFNQSYPLLAGFMGWLNDRTLKEQTK